MHQVDLRPTGAVRSVAKLQRLCQRIADATTAHEQGQSDPYRGQVSWPAQSVSPDVVPPATASAMVC